MPGFERVVARDEALELLPEAQWLVAALPLTEHTRDYFDAEFFRRCRGAGFINVGRGATVVFDALKEALDTDRLSTAVLDVLAHEPPGPDDPYWQLPRTVITPHTAGVTAESDIITDFTRCWVSLSQGRVPDLAVDLKRGY